MKKVFVIMKRHFEYNDEIYYSSDDDAGSVNTVFSNKAKAYDECKKLNEKMYAGLMLGYYFYEISPEVLTKANQIIGKDIFDIDELGETEIPTDLTQNQYEQLSELFDLNFFYVQETKQE